MSGRSLRVWAVSDRRRTVRERRSGTKSPSGRVGSIHKAGSDVPSPWFGVAPARWLDSRSRSENVWRAKRRGAKDVHVHLGIKVTGGVVRSATEGDL